jgi:predicted neutral ceramidase superfamily lipid hydrolase
MEAKGTGVPQALRRNAKRFKGFTNTKRIKYISIISVVVFLAILALIILLAVILPRRIKLPKSFASTVLVPLYIYPIDGAWEPLYEM